jgi:hypothetical protein
MSDYTVVVENLEPNIVIVETSFIDTLKILEIERSISSVNIITQSNIINVSDLPEIPFSKIIGNLSVYRIDGLDDYLNHYSFDCGTP